MDRHDIESALQGIMEDLARLEHERWSHWQRYVHAMGARQADGSIVIPANLIEQWDRQIATPYDQLSEKEKESDREQVKKYLPRIIDKLAT